MKNIQELNLSKEEEKDLQKWLENNQLKTIHEYIENWNFMTDISEKFNEKEDGKVCVICGKDTPRTINNKRYCQRHYDMIRRQGCLNPYSRTTPNEIRIYDGYCSIITRDKEHNINGEFMVDDISVYSIIKHKWYKSAVNYCETHHRLGRLHCFLLPTDKGLIADHIDRNPYDNRLSNLRVVTRGENNVNKSIQRNNSTGITGVNKENKGYVVYITPMGKRRLRLGLFTDLKEATIARLNAEVKHYGKFAPQQHLYEEYGIDDSNVEYDPPYKRPIEMTLKRALELYKKLLI